MNRAFVDTSVLLRFLVKDDDLKARAVEKLLRTAPGKGTALHILPVTMLEIVWVLEKVYKFGKKDVRGLAEAIINTTQFKVEMGDVFLKALKAYEEKNVKFADAVMAYWGLEKKISIAYTYDEKDFRRIEGMTVKKP